MSQSATLGLMLSLSGLMACAFPERTVVPPPPVELRDVTLRAIAYVDSVPPDSSDFAVAAELGWSAGIPGVLLRIQALDEDAPVREAVTGADGTLEVLDLPVGHYQVEGLRLLSAAEKSQLTNASAEAFVGTSVIQVSGTGEPIHAITLPVSRRRGLVMSEWAFHGARIAPLLYWFGGFVELYNNGTEVEYVDGIILASTIAASGDTPSATYGCAWYSALTYDVEGPWSTYFVAFPGSGADYPVLPGETVLVAMDAIDHRELFPQMLDLRGADFEMSGGPDNPAVPDMIDRSLRANPAHDHGPPWSWVGASAAVMVRPGDVGSYVRREFESTGIPHARVPAVDIVDALSTHAQAGSSTPGWRRCDHLIHPRFDRRSGFLLRGADDEYLTSQSRKVLYLDESGRPVLQHTRSTAADWVRSPRSPGVIAP